jgi:hypothetical protein
MFAIGRRKGSPQVTTWITLCSARGNRVPKNPATILLCPMGGFKNFFGLDSPENYQQFLGCYRFDGF